MTDAAPFSSLGAVLLEISEMMGKQRIKPCLLNSSWLAERHWGAKLEGKNVNYGPPTVVSKQPLLSYLLP